MFDRALDFPLLVLELRRGLAHRLREVHRVGRHRRRRRRFGGATRRVSVILRGFRRLLIGVSSGRHGGVVVRVRDRPRGGRRPVGRYPVRLEHFLGQVAVPPHHHSLELQKVVHGQDGARDEITELPLRVRALDDVHEPLGGDAQLVQEIAQQTLHQVLELVVHDGELQLVLLLVVEHQALGVDEPHEGGGVHRTLQVADDRLVQPGRGRVRGIRGHRSLARVENPSSSCGVA